jgi:hypothetical protein
LPENLFTNEAPRSIATRYLIRYYIPISEAELRGIIPGEIKNTSFTLFIYKFNENPDISFEGYFK